MLMSLLQIPDRPNSLEKGLKFGLRDVIGNVADEDLIEIQHLRVGHQS